MIKTSVNYFKPPLEYRNPELLIQEHKNFKLKDILKEKHKPLHKVLSQRPKSSVSTRSSYYSNTGNAFQSDSPSKPKKEFSYYQQIPMKKKLEIKEKQRKSTIVNGRIQQINRDKTYNQN